MSDPSIENGTPRTLPKALRNPKPRSVELLLESRLPARMAWVDADGNAQVAPMWFEWVDAELLISTFTGAKKLSNLVDGARIAITIDTAEFPYRSVKMSGPITLERSDGLTDSYRSSARRYLGDAAGEAWCEALSGKAQTLIRMSPSRASSSDMSLMPFMTT